MDDLTLYKQLVELTPICIKVFDPTGKLIFLNKGGREEHFIKDGADISKWDWAATVKEQYRSKVLEAFNQGLKGQASHIEMEHKPEGSKHHWCEGIISPITDKAGQVTALLFYSIDATAKKEGELKILANDKELSERIEVSDKLNHILLSRESMIRELRDKVAALEKGK